MSVSDLHATPYPGAAFFGFGAAFRVVRRNSVSAGSNHSVPWRGAMELFRMSGSDQSRGAISRVTNPNPFL